MPATPRHTRTTRARLAVVLYIALLALTRHRLRSVLATLGISIGVGALLCSVAVGQGAARQIEDHILCAAVSPEAIAPAEAQMTALLRERHRVRSGQEDDCNLRHPAEIAEARAAAQRTMTLLLASVAAVALLVGGIGIMHIMLVSVTERTREIGLRRAVGARERDILTQFLVEAVTVALLGGGSGLGPLGTYGIAAVAGWQTLIRADALVVAVSCAGAVGIGFGFYPAWRAARLDPIEALRR